LAEANKPEYLAKAFDLDYAWPFLKTLTDVLENGAPADSLVASWRNERERYPQGALEMRFTENNDEKRAITRFGERATLAASLLVFTMDGVPLIHSGAEVGDTAESDGPALSDRLSIFWPNSQLRPDFLPFYKQLIALRHHTAMQDGETEWVQSSAPDRILTFFRRSLGEEYFVAINLTNRPFSGVAEAPEGEYVDETPGIAATKKKVAPPVLILGAWDFRVYRKVH
jgi:glycosidase